MKSVSRLSFMVSQRRSGPVLAEIIRIVLNDTVIPDGLSSPPRSRLEHCLRGRRTRLLGLNSSKVDRFYVDQRHKRAFFSSVCFERGMVTEFSLLKGFHDLSTIQEY